MNIYLDPIREPLNSFAETHNNIYVNQPWKIVTDFQGFILEVVKNGIPEKISYAFDIDPTRKTSALDCMEWLITQCRYADVAFPEIIYHCINPVGKKKVDAVISDYETEYLLKHAVQSSSTLLKVGYQARLNFASAHDDYSQQFPNTVQKKNYYRP